MTNEEREAWEEIVDLADMCPEESEVVFDKLECNTILATAAELKRLLEALEWALKTGQTSHTWKAELRRRVKGPE